MIEFTCHDTDSYVTLRYTRDFWYISIYMRAWICEIIQAGDLKQAFAGSIYVQIVPLRFVCWCFGRMCCCFGIVLLSLMPVPHMILLLLPSFDRSRSLGGIYHQVGILLSSCSCSTGHDFGLGLLLHLRVCVCYVMR